MKRYRMTAAALMIAVAVLCGMEARGEGNRENAPEKTAKAKRRRDRPESGKRYQKVLERARENIRKMLRKAEERFGSLKNPDSVEQYEKFKDACAEAERAIDDEPVRSKEGRAPQGYYRIKWLQSRAATECSLLEYFAGKERGLELLAGGGDEGQLEKARNYVRLNELMIEKIRAIRKLQDEQVEIEARLREARRALHLRAAAKGRAAKPDGKRGKGKQEKRDE